MAKAHPVIVHLVASGSTAWMEADRLQGNTDLPLSDRGRAEVMAAAGHWRPVLLKIVYSAPDEASRQTARLLAEEAGGVKIKVVDELGEMNLGLWQGLEVSALQDRYPKAFGLWRQQPALVMIPEGESLGDAADRMRATMTRLLDKAGGEPVAVVLRPILAGLCRAWLEGRPVDEWNNGVEKPIIQRFELDAVSYGRIRSDKQKKRISA